MYPATINQLGNLFYVYFQNTVVGIYENYRDAESHAHGINLVI